MVLKRQVLALTATFVTIGVLAFGLSIWVGDSTILKLLLNLNLAWIVLLIGAQLAAYGAYSLAYRTLFRLRTKAAILHTLHGFSPMAPLGGFAHDVRTLHGAKERHRVAALSIVEYLILAPAVLVAAIVALANHSNIASELTIPWVIGVPSGLIAAAILIANRGRAKKINQALAGSLDKLIKEFTGLRAINRFLILGGIGLYWASELASLFAALRIFDAALNLPAIIIAYATGYVLTRRSLPSSLIGITIALLILSLHWVGLSYATGFLVTYAYLIVNILMPLGYLTVRKAERL